MPVGKSIVGAFSIFSQADTVKMIISMDRGTMDSVTPLNECLCKALDEILGGPEWREFGKKRIEAAIKGK